MGLIVVKTKTEEKKFLELVKEFAARVVLPRDFKATPTFNEFKKIKVFGIIDHTKDDVTSEVIYDVALPDAYLGFIQFELDRLEVPKAVPAPTKKGRKSSKRSD